ncbi:MAG: S9 family peptidase [Gemmatimonadaceae bacterium]
MHPNIPRAISSTVAPLAVSLALTVALTAATTGDAAAQASDPGAAVTGRAMVPLDMQHIRRVGSPTPSPDGTRMLYTLSTPDWKEATRQTDLYLVSMTEGVASTRRLTFTDDKQETSPAWSRDGQSFVFASDREAPSTSPSRNQLYLMRPDGGEARRITDAKDGVSTFAFDRDGRWLVYRSGESDEEQLYARPVAGIDSATPVKLTSQATGVGLWKWAPDGRRIYFITADTTDADEKARLEKKFSVAVRNAETPLSSLWALDMETRQATRLTRDSTLTVTSMSISPDGGTIGFRGIATDRYKRNVTEQAINGDLYLLDVASGSIERLTSNEEVRESELSFSPDGQMIAFSAADDLTRFSMKNTRLYLRRTDARGGQWRKLGGGFDGDVTIGFWSQDGRTVYFNEGIRATNQLMALDVARDEVRQVTNAQASTSVDQDEDSRRLIVSYADPTTPPTLFTVSSPEALARRASWKQLTDANPQVRDLALGEEEEIFWTSTDGRRVGGILVKPVGYRKGERYPLIVAIHGGPASADVLQFNGGYGAQSYAGSGYAVLKPNYRGSTNYGEKHKTDIVGNYFQKGYEDIMTGVDHLIAQGIVDSTRMGVLGWSAGGHWSNWILTHTDRFRAISSGAGTSNWVSMYAQSDMQRNRQYYLGDKLPYDDYDAYWDQSPLKYIRNAKTPTMIHVVDGDPRVPRPQSEELHMALKRLGVPTELYVYPGRSHGIPDPRNQLVKAVSEKAWMDYWVLGSGRRFAWRDVLKTIEDDAAGAPSAAIGAQRLP